MNTIIILTTLAVVLLLLEIINFRKAIIPIAILGLGAALVTINEPAFFDFEHYEVLSVTNFSKGFTCLLIVLTMGIIALGYKFYNNQLSKLSDFISLKIFLLIGGICMVSFNHFVMFFLGLEILSITLYILAGSRPQDIKSNESAMKYFLMGSFASGFILFGIALIYGATANFYISEITNLLIENGTNGWFTIGFGLIAIGLLFKVAAFPFHFWAPDVYHGSPALTTATMSTVAKVAAIGAFFVLAQSLQQFMPAIYTQLLGVIIILTLFIGNISAIKQNNIKRILAFSGVSHAGFMLFAFLYIGTAIAAEELLYYAAAYATAGIAAFSAILYVIENQKEEFVKYFKGLGKKNPLVALILSLSLLSMAGIPILSGFFGKVFLFKSAFEHGYIFLVIFGIINSIISVYYYLRIIITIYTPLVEGEAEIQTSQSIIYPLVGVVFIIINILIGIQPSIVSNLI